MSNPFYLPGRPIPPELFVGRDREIDIAFDSITTRSHLSIYGSSGMGKSVFLQYLSSPEIWQQRGLDCSKVFMISLNCEGIIPFTPSQFWHEILGLLKEQVAQETYLYSEIERLLQQEIIITRELRLILQKIGEQDKYLLLFIDDYDTVIQPNKNYSKEDVIGFLREFRDLAVHRREGRFLSTVVTTFRRLNELGPQVEGGSPWYNFYFFQLLKPFSQEDMVSLFFRDTAPLYIPIPITWRSGIIKITGGHPALLQIAGYLLHFSVQNNQLSNIDEFIKDFQSRTEQFFCDTWNFSTDIEQVLLMLIALSSLEGRLNKRQYALGDIDRIFSQKGRELIDLEERGVIEKRRDQGKAVYFFSSSLMEWWVLKEIENSDSEQLSQREKVFLKVMSRQQTRQVKKVFQSLWKNRETVQSIVDVIRKLFTGI